MSVNKFMHPRNIYRVRPDYTDLAIKYSEFRQKCKLHLKGYCTINLKKIENLIALTKCLLKHDFNLEIDIPNDSLVPTVPLRLNYILWLEDIMSTMKIENPIGIDIGCGASCIYSILCARKNNWKMYALETNEKNIEYAQKNINRNDLNQNIKIFHQTNKNDIFKTFLSSSSNADDVDGISFDFCLCNPPFFDTNSLNDQESDEINVNEEKKDISLSPSKISKRPLPKNAVTGKLDELSCEGGEISFVKKIIDESFMFQNRIKIYSTMIGRKCDVNVLLKIFKEKNITNYIQAEFCQGNTTRWGIAWTFYPNYILALVPQLRFEKHRKQFTCTLQLKKNFETWKQDFLDVILKMGLNLEILKENDMSIQLLIKSWNSICDDEKLSSPRKRKFSGQITCGDINESMPSVKKSKLDEHSQNMSEIVVENKNENSTTNLGEYPKSVFKIDAERINKIVNFKVTYFCGQLGIDECYRWFCLIKNKFS